MTDKDHCNYVIGGSEKPCDHIFLNEPSKDCLSCKYYTNKYEILSRKVRCKSLSSSCSKFSLKKLRRLSEIEPQHPDLRGWGLSFSDFKTVISDLISEKTKENKDALLLFLSENSLDILNEILLRPIPNKELLTWALTLDEYKDVIQKAIQNILNNVVSEVTIKTNDNDFAEQALNECLFPMFFEGCKVLICDSLKMDKDGLPSSLSLLLKDTKGNETRKIYLRKEE